MSSLDKKPAFNSHDSWLTQYYLGRAAFSVAWVALAVTLGRQNDLLGMILLTIYPLWDAAANFVDARRNGGPARNQTQAINIAVSAATTAAVLVALRMGLNAVLAVFGTWAILSGLLQLATAVRRWKSGAQWAMALSGAQSALAGAFFVIQAQQPLTAVIPTIAGYAGFGAVYFFVSAVWLIVGGRLRKKAVG